MGRRVLSPSGCASIVFAHKTTEGWEALLAGIIESAWCITASWPIATELKTRLNARDTASLATSVHLVCRPRSENAPIGDWTEVLYELPQRVKAWMDRLQSEGVRGADLVFACIGPALEIFSRYSKVETAGGEEVVLSAYLEKVWETVGRIALEQILGTAESCDHETQTAAPEEDARLTALFLWTLQSTKANGNGNGQKNHTKVEPEESDEDEEEEEEETPRSKSKGFSLIFDVVRRFAQPLGIRLPDWENRIIKTEKGIVRLLPVTERAKQLFGEEGAEAVAVELERSPKMVGVQLHLFPEMNRAAPTPEASRGRRRPRAVAKVSAGTLQPAQEATTLDRIHAAMLLQKSGHSNALRSLLKAEQDRSPDFLRLANALSALYPAGSEEKRLVDAMLLAVPR